MSLEKAKSIEAGLHAIVGTEYTDSLITYENVASDEPKSFLYKLKFIVKNMTVEPVLFCYILPGVMNVLATQNFGLEKCCRVNLNLGEDICDALTARNVTHHASYKVDEENVQQLAAQMTVIKNVIQSIFPGALLLFLGSWSDRHLRRKPCIIAPILGDITMCVLLMICTFFFYELPVEINSISEALPPALTGSWLVMFMGVYSYVSDVSTEKERTLRIGAINMVQKISMCMGTALSGILYEKLGLYGVYILSLVFYFVGLGYGLIKIKDTYEIKNDCEEENGQKLHNKVLIKTEMKFTNEAEDDTKLSGIGLVKDFFRTEHVTDTLNSVFKAGGKRGNNKRIYGVFLLFLVTTGPLYGEFNVIYYYVRYRFEWDAVQYSFFSTFQFVTNTLGTIFSLMLFTKYLKVDDSILGMISCLSKVIAAGFYAFAPSPLFLYLGAIVECLNGTSFIAVRAMISKLVPPEELGKMNAIFGVGEAIVPLIYGPLYSRLYAYTIDFFPGCFYIVGGGLTCPAILIFFWLYLDDKRNKDTKTGQTHKENLLKTKEDTDVNA